jgi:hypothetical protein
VEPVVAYKPKKGPEPDPAIAQLLERGMHYVEEWAQPGSDKPPAPAAAKPSVAAAPGPRAPAPKPVPSAPKAAADGAADASPSAVESAPGAEPAPVPEAAKDKPDNA